MSERIDIVNMALGMIGEDPISSLEDETNTAIQAKIQYIPARDSTLEAHDWTFAVERFMPAKLTAEPIYGASSYFSIPTNIIRVIACDNVSSSALSNTVSINSREQIDWQLEGRNIICNEEVVYARGIRRVEDEGIFSPLFVQAFAAKLAMLMALNLTASSDILDKATGMFQFFMDQAKSRDGLQGRSRRIRNRSMQKAR